MFCGTQAGKVSSNTGKLSSEGLVHLLRCIRKNNNLVLKYYAKIEDAPISDLLRQDIINTENQLMVLSDSIWQERQHTGTITGAYIVFYQGTPIDHCTNVLGPVS